MAGCAYIMAGGLRRDWRWIDFCSGEIAKLTWFFRIAINLDHHG